MLQIHEFACLDLYKTDSFFSVSFDFKMIRL